MRETNEYTIYFYICTVIPTPSHVLLQKPWIFVHEPFTKSTHSPFTIVTIESSERRPLKRRTSVPKLADWSHHFFSRCSALALLFPRSRTWAAALIRYLLPPHLRHGKALCRLILNIIRLIPQASSGSRLSTRSVKRACLVFRKLLTRWVWVFYYAHRWSRSERIQFVYLLLGFLTKHIFSELEVINHWRVQWSNSYLSNLFILGSLECAFWFFLPLFSFDINDDVCLTLPFSLVVLRFRLTTTLTLTPFSCAGIRNWNLYDSVFPAG